MSTDTDLGFEEFVHARLPRLLRFGRALTGDENAAADLVQDALERTLPRWSRVIAGEGDPEAYVRRVMVTRNVSLWRRVRRERLTDAVPDTGARDAEPPWESAVWQAVAALPAKQRTVMALRYYDDLSEAEIAEVLGVSRGTVKSQASRAREALRAALGTDTMTTQEAR